MIPHRARFLRGRRSLLEAHRREPHAPVADEARDVDADASRGDELEIFPVRRPIPVFRLRIVLESADASSRYRSLIGAGESPQFPITCVVTPCRTAHSAVGSTRIPISLCVWISMKPGAMYLPS